MITFIVGAEHTLHSTFNIIDTFLDIAEFIK